MELAEQNRQNKAARKGLPGQDCQHRTTSTRLQDKTVRVGQKGEDSQKRTVRTGQLEQDSQNYTARTNSQNRAANR
jgi:hypothetical protein